VRQTIKIALIHVMQETNTFNSVPTTLADFANVALLEGDEMLRYVDPNGPIAGYLEAIDSSQLNVQTIPLLRADAQSGGRLSRETLDELCRRVGNGLRQAQPVDGIMVFLHGAASADGIDDVEGQILSTIREVSGPKVSLALMLDHHANVTRKMMELTDLTMAFRTQPHDPFETARDLTQIALRYFTNEIRPTTAWRKIPMITHQEQYLTVRGPMKELFDHARRLEAEGSALTISLFPMQPWLDVDEAGWSLVVVTDDNQEVAEQLADDLADIAWSMRHRFMVKENLPIADAIQFADDPNRGIVLLSDTGDSVLGGSSGDSTVILFALVESPPQHRALVPLTDPIAARHLANRQPGETVTIDLGGWANSFYSPLRVTGTLRTIRDGTVSLAGLPQGSVNMGKSAILDIGNVTILVTEYAGVGGIHPDVYRHLDVEPGDYKIIVMKTASNFQYMKDLTTSFVRVATPGPTQSDICSLPWSRIPRPMFPLDPIENWRA